MKRAHKSARRGFFWFAAVTGVIAFAAVVLLSSDLLVIREFEIVGNHEVAVDDILLASGISLRQNILSFSPRAAQNSIENLPFVRSALVLRDYPDRVVISVSERMPIAYTRFFNTYLLLDNHGMVLDVSATAARGLPVVVGLDITSFAVGEYLDLANLRIFDCIILLSGAFARHNFDLAQMVDISNPAQIRIIADGIIINFGSTDDSDRKIQDIAAIIQAMPSDVRGQIHISDPALPPRFEPLR